MHLLLSMFFLIKQYASAGWGICSFNARHEVPVEELEYHMSICPDKVKKVLFQSAF